jgi:hypothetical protein
MKSVTAVDVDELQLDIPVNRQGGCTVLWQT